MGKTYKRHAFGYFRSPKGRKKAIINNCRHGAIPPDPWDDIPICRSAWIPGKIARRLYKNGSSKDEIREVLSKKFHLNSLEIKNILSWFCF